MPKEEDYDYYLFYRGESAITKFIYSMWTLWWVPYAVSEKVYKNLLVAFRQKRKTAGNFAGDLISPRHWHFKVSPAFPGGLLRAIPSRMYPRSNVCPRLHS